VPVDALFFGASDFLLGLILAMPATLTVVQLDRKVFDILCKERRERTVNVTNILFVSFFVILHS
jgi:hypothetical protein